jgi:hypothetical protein
MLRSDSDHFPGCGVSADARVTTPDVKRAEVAELDAAPSDESGRHGQDERVDCGPHVLGMDLAVARDYSLDKF